MKNTKNKKIFKIKIALFIAVFGLTFFAPFSYQSQAQAKYSNNLVIDLVNKARANNGLATLTENQELNASAASKAADMIANDYFEHTSPSGITPWYWFSKSNYEYTYAGENLAINYYDSDTVMNAWMASPTHKANILGTNYKEIGVASINGEFKGSKVFIIVQHFGTEKAQTNAVAGTNNQVAQSPQTQVPQAQPNNNQSQGLKQSSENSANQVSSNYPVIENTQITKANSQEPNEQAEKVQGKKPALIAIKEKIETTFVNYIINPIKRLFN